MRPATMVSTGNISYTANPGMPKTGIKPQFGQTSSMTLPTDLLSAAKKFLDNQNASTIPETGAWWYLGKANKAANVLTAFNPLLNITTSAVNSLIGPYVQQIFNRELMELGSKYKIRHIVANTTSGLTLTAAIGYAAWFAQKKIGETRLNQKLKGAVEKMPLGAIRKTHFEDIKGYHSTKAQIEDTVDYLLAKDPTDPNISMMVYGPPGTGKSDIASAILTRYHMRLPGEGHSSIVRVNASQLVSEPGMGAKKVNKIKEHILKAKGDTVFIPIDEADSLSSRAKEGSGSEAGKVINQLLPLMEGQLENLNKRVVWMFITNHPKSLDSAFLDRIQTKVHVPLPNQVELKDILNEHLSRKNLRPKGKMDMNEILQQCEGFSGRQIKNTTLNLKRMLKGKSEFTQEQLLQAIRNVKGHEDEALPAYQPVESPPGYTRSPQRKVGPASALPPSYQAAVNKAFSSANQAH